MSTVQEEILEAGFLPDLKKVITAWKPHQRIRSPCYICGDLLNVMGYTDLDTPLPPGGIRKLPAVRILGCGHLYCSPCMERFVLGCTADAYDVNTRMLYFRCPWCRDPHCCRRCGRLFNARFVPTADGIPAPLTIPEVVEKGSDTNWGKGWCTPCMALGPVLEAYMLRRDAHNFRSEISVYTGQIVDDFVFRSIERMLYFLSLCQGVCPTAADFIAVFPAGPSDAVIREAEAAMEELLHMYDINNWDLHREMPYRRVDESNTVPADVHSALLACVALADLRIVLFHRSFEPEFTRLDALADLYERSLPWEEYFDQDKERFPTEE